MGLNLYLLIILSRIDIVVREILLAVLQECLSGLSWGHSLNVLKGVLI